MAIGLYPCGACAVDLMAAADGVVYLSVDNLPETSQSATQPEGASNFLQGTGQMIALSGRAERVRSG